MMALRYNGYFSHFIGSPNVGSQRLMQLLEDVKDLVSIYLSTPHPQLMAFVLIVLRWLLHL